MPDGFRFYERKKCIEHMISRKNYKNESGFNIERANAIKALNQYELILMVTQIEKIKLNL